MWQESYDKIKDILPNIKCIRGFDIFNIIEPYSWLIIDDLVESIKEWSQEMLLLIMVLSYYEKFFSSALITSIKQIYPGEPKFLLSEYNQVTNKSYEHILLNLNQNPPRE